MNTFKRRNNIMPVDQTGITKDYTDGRLAVCFKLNNLGAGLEQFYLSIPSDINFLDRHSVVIAVNDRYVAKTENSNGRNETLVLIEVVEFGENVNQVIRPLSVCVKTLDKIYKSFGGPFKFASKPFFEVGLIFINWESGIEFRGISIAP